MFALAVLAALLRAAASAGTQEAAAPDACMLAEAAHDFAQVSLPFRIMHGRVYIDAAVNGEGPYTFAVDTGASGLGRADASLTATLQLPVTGQAETGDGVTVARVDTVHLSSLDVGGLVREDLDLITRDYSSSVAPEAAISGIVGREFFADGLLVIDFPKQTLTFSRTASLAPDATGALAYDRPFRVPVTIGGVATTANLDTGAGVALVLPLSFYEQISIGQLEDGGQAQLTNTTIKTGRAMVPGPVVIGGTSTADVETRVSESFPEALVGAHILQNYIIAIDQRSQRIAVCSDAGKQ